MCLDEMVELEDHMEEEVVLEFFVPTFVCTFICVEIKTNTKTVTSRVFQKVETTLVREVQFFLFLSWRRSVPQTRFFFNLQFFTFCLTYYQPYESMTGPIGQRLLT
jgi:hypothetical protein